MATRKPARARRQWRVVVSPSMFRVSFLVEGFRFFATAWLWSFVYTCVNRRAECLIEMRDVYDWDDEEST